MTLSTILPRYRPRRIFVFNSDNPCDEIPLLKNMVLYALSVSYGLRIDTVVIIKTGKMLAVLSGQDLRHFHPQDKSLTNFLASIACNNKLYPGVHILSSLEMSDLYNYKYLLITRRLTGPINTPLTTCKFSGLLLDNIIVDPYGDRSLASSADIIYIPRINIDPIYFTIATNYILDLAYGGWIRRRGRIEWRRNSENNGYSVNSSKASGKIPAM